MIPPPVSYAEQWHADQVHFDLSCLEHEEDLIFSFLLQGLARAHSGRLLVKAFLADDAAWVRNWRKTCLEPELD